MSPRLNVEARFETAAWPDRLGLILAARPGAGVTVQSEPGGLWKDAAMEIRLATAKGTLHQRWEPPKEKLTQG